MKEIVSYNKFYDTGEPKRERENFQQFHFDKLDLSKALVPISFHRSDFRGAKITDCRYFKNNFENADFIDCVVIDSAFVSCSFKYTELYNSYYQNVIFQETAFSSASQVKLVYKNCFFLKIKFRINTFRDCKYFNTTIKGCNFQRSSMDEVEFEKVTFSSVDLSSMTAINLYFNNCNFENVVIDADYLGSYFFKGKLPENIRMKYRGKLFDFDITQVDLLNSLFMLLWEKERYYEAINILVQKNVFHKHNVTIIDRVKYALQLILINPNELRRTYQIDKIFRLFEYYFNSSHVLVSDYFKFIQLMDDCDLSALSFQEQLLVNEKLQKLKMIIDSLPLEDAFILSEAGNALMAVEITIDEADQEAFERTFDHVVRKLSYGTEAHGEPYYIAGIRKGSLIYDIVMYASSALLLLKLLKTSLKEARAVVHQAMQFKIDYKANKTLAAQFESSVSLDKLQKIRKAQAYPEKVIFSNNGISDRDLQELSPIVKKMTLHPNQLPNAG